MLFNDYQGLRTQQLVVAICFSIMEALSYFVLLLVSLSAVVHDSGEFTRKGFYVYDDKRKASPDSEIMKYVEKARKASQITVDSKVSHPFPPFLSFMLYLSDSWLNQGEFFKSSVYSLITANAWIKIGIFWESYPYLISYTAHNVPCKWLTNLLRVLFEFQLYFSPSITFFIFTVTPPS